MGGKVGKVLPLIALAGVGLATGGFGLLGAGAGAAGAGAAAGAAGAAASSGGFLSGLASQWGTMSALSKIGLGMQAVSGVGGMVNASMNADQQNAMLALQQGQKNVSNATQGLEISQRALATQQRLRKTLAALSVRANAFGADLSSGSASNLMDASYFNARGAMQPFAAQRRLVGDSGRLSSQTYAYKRRAIGAKQTGSVIGDLLNFGGRAVSTFNKYNSKGY